MTKKNHRLRDLLLNKEDMELLNRLSKQLKMKNSDLARLIIHNKLKEIDLLKLNTFELAIIGISSENRENDR